MSEFVRRLNQRRAEEATERLKGCRCDPFEVCSDCKSDRALVREHRGPSLSTEQTGA